MNELIQFIFSLGDQVDPIGKSIIKLIYFFFWIGVAVYGLHVLRLCGEYIILRYIKNYIKINHGLGDISSDYLDKLGAKIYIKYSIIYRRIHDLAQIKKNGGQIDNDTLGDIHAGEASRKGNLSSYILGILIILGLIGTLRGLINAIIEVQPLLQDIQDLDQLPTISAALRQTLAGMNTAFGTTLVGLGTSLLLGFCGWFFNQVNSTFLTHFERYVSTDILPHFTQAPESAIESTVIQLAECTDTLKLATKENAIRMQEAIDKITGTPWNEYLESPYLLIMNIKTSSENLYKSLEDIRSYQREMKLAVESFDEFARNSMTQISEFQSAVEGYKEFTNKSIETFTESITRSMSQITEYQEALRDGLDNVVPSLQIEREALRLMLEKESSELKETMEESRKTQARFVDEIAEALQERLQSIADSQQVMVQELQQLAGELKIRSALEKQTQEFQAIKSQLIENQKETVDSLTELKNDLQVRDAIEAQNKVFGRIESHLGGQATLVSEQKDILKTLDSSVKQLQQTYSKTSADDQEATQKLLHQISLNFITMTEKMEDLNKAMSRPGVYRWGSEIRRWFGFSRK